MRKICSLTYVAIFLIFIMVPFTTSSAKDSGIIYLTESSFNADRACWEFKIEYKSNERIYYTFKDNITLDATYSYVNSGQVISVPSSLMKNSYKTLKLFTLDEMGNIDRKMYYKIDKIVRNTYVNDLSKLCYTLFDDDDSQYTKARKLYTWIGENKIYEYSKIGNNEYNAFYGVGSDSFGLSQLYADLCTVSGIKCEVVNSYNIDYDYAKRHSWNHIYLNNNAYLVDVYWSGVCFYNEPNYSHFCNNSIVNNIVTPNYDLSSTKYDNFYDYNIN